MNDKNPRQIALDVLQSRQPGGEFTETLLDRVFVSGQLSGDLAAGQPKTMSRANRALCHELVCGVIRAQSALDWLIARKTGGRRQNAAIQNVLRLGLYQIFWLDRIPVHAAVHETVELAKHDGPGQKARFVNAVLRGYLREFDATKKLLGELKVSNPALAFSHPQWLVDKWEKLFGRENLRGLLEWNNTPPKNFARVNTLKTDPGKLLERWREENVEYDFVRRDFLQRRGLVGGAAGDPPHYDPETTVFELKSHPPLASLPSFCDGWFYVQDPSTLLAPLELAPQAGETILDLCAAPGGKTTFIAQLMGNSGKIIACDVSEERLKLLEKNCDRLGAKSVHLANGLLAGRPGRSAMNTSIGNDLEPFDKILIDAPCSNTGVLRRRVDLRWRISPGEIGRLRNVQLELLELAAPKLRRGGALIYSTCSLEPEENSRVVGDFLEGHSQFKLEFEREILPFRDSLDGAFIARLRRS